MESDLLNDVGSAPPKFPVIRPQLESLNRVPGDFIALYLCIQHDSRIPSTMDRPTSSFGIALAIFLLLISITGHSQFTYFGMAFGYGNQQLNGDDGRNFAENWTIRLSMLHRPLRNVGLGISYPIHLSQRSFYTPTGLGGYGGWGNGYKPTVVTKVQNTQEFGAFVRVFADTEVNAFLDLRLTSYLFEQSFSLTREYRPAEYNGSELWYAAVPSRSTSFASAARSLAPGFGIGLAPRIGKHGFFSLQFEMDFVRQRAQAFSTRIESNSGFRQTWYEYKTINTDLNGGAIVWYLGIGGGYFF